MAKHVSLFFCPYPSKHLFNCKMPQTKKRYQLKACIRKKKSKHKAPQKIHNTRGKENTTKNPPQDTMKEKQKPHKETTKPTQNK